MTIERTISGMMGKGSISHNERKFIAENVDATRTVQNEVLISDKLKDVYHDLMMLWSGIMQNRNGMTGRFRTTMNISGQASRKSCSMK